MRLTVAVADWNGSEYVDVSALQRTMIAKAMSRLHFEPDDWVLDIGCGDGHLTAAIAASVPNGGAVGADASPRMIEVATASVAGGESPPLFVVADALALPFTQCFDAAVSFNALHWVPRQDEALRQIAHVVKAGGRITVQMVCAGERPSLEATAMSVTRRPEWRDHFRGFSAPFVHVAPSEFRAVAETAGLRVHDLTVADETWQFDSRDAFHRWCAVGSTAWTDRLPQEERDRFVADEVAAYEAVVERPGLFRFLQMRADLRH